MEIYVPSIRGNQERYIHAERFTGETYPIPITYRLRGPLDIQRLSSAVDDIVARTPILTTRFATTNDGISARPAAIRPTLEIVDLPDGATDDEIHARIQKDVFEKPADLTAHEMVRLKLYRFGENDAILLLSLHHALSDGVSMGILARQIESHYNGEPVEHGTDYYDIAGQIDASEASRTYWTRHLDGLEQPPGLPEDLALTREDADPRPVVVPLDRAELDRLSQAWRVSRFSAFATLSQTVFARATGTETMALSFQSAGRRNVPHVDGTIGPLSNALILTASVTQGTALPALAADQQRLIREAVAHEDHPYQSVVRDTGLQPDFGINWFPAAPPLRLDGLAPAPRDLVDTRTNYDVDFRVVEDGEALHLVAYYRSHLFSRARVERLVASLTEALSRAAERPEGHVGDLFEAPQPITVPAPAPRTPERLFDGFLAQAGRAPDRVALVGDGWRMTYGEVEAASAALARRLVARGLGPGSRVGILAERGPQLVWTEIAVLRIGATMVPLDAAYPPERLRLLSDLARIDALVIPDPSAQPDWIGAEAAVIAADDPKARVPGAQEVPDAAIAAGDPDRPAYILFTSGSTGTPKGVATSHVPALHFLDWQRRTFGIGPQDRFTNLNGVAHDMMIRDIFQPLSIGGELAIPRQEDIYRPGRLIEWIVQMQPTAMHMTPAMGNLLVLAGKPGQVLPMRLIFSGGDQLLPDLTRKIATLAPDAVIVNFYGATETPQAAAYHVVRPDSALKSHPIGRGIDDVSVRIVDGAHDPVAPGVSGEIAIASPYPSLGYLKDGEIVPHAQTGLYFTGDTGFELPDGEVMFTGRQDDQISIRGYRIELGEIVHALGRVEGVQDAKVLLDSKADNPALVAFVVPREGAAPDADRIYKEISRALPHYMVPKDIVILPKFPLLPNGKLDRMALLAAPRPQHGRAEGRAADTRTERELCAIWARILGVESVSPDRNFVELRGDSLNFVEVCLATEAVVGDLPQDWEEMTVAEIAALKAEAPGTSPIKWIETPLFVRAVAIVLVVTLHLNAFSLGGGATSALFMVSGFLIARLQLKAAFTTSSVRPFWSLIAKVMVPSALYVLAIASVKLFLGMPVAPEMILFLEDFVDMRDGARMVAEGHMIPLWYISCFFHILLMLMALLWVARKVFGPSLTPFNFVLGTVIFGIALRFCLPFLFVEGYPAVPVDPMAAVSHMPMMHFGLFAVGMGIGMATTVRERLLYTVLTGLVVLGSLMTLQTSTPWLIGGVGLAMLYVAQLPIPRILHRAVFMVSGASLFIYLTHQQFAKIGLAVGIPSGSLALVAMAIAGGIVIWMAWLKCVSLATGSVQLFRQGTPGGTSGRRGREATRSDDAAQFQT